MTSSGWLSACKPTLRQKILSSGQPTRLERGEVLFRVGDPPKGVYGVAVGAVHIAMPADDGQELVIYHTGAGFWAGDLELLSEMPRMATVAAASPTLCLFLSRQQLRTLLDSDPEYYREFYKMSYENGRTIMRALANMTVIGSEKRLALRLLQYDEDTSDPDAWITVSQNQLAMATALSVPTLERALGKMAKAGLIEIGYGKLRILDRAELAGVSRA